MRCHGMEFRGAEEAPVGVDSSYCDSFAVLQCGERFRIISAWQEQNDVLDGREDGADSFE